jgi:hypothetical protein
MEDQEKSYASHFITGNREQGIGNREQGTGNREQVVFFFLLLHPDS